MGYGLGVDIGTTFTAAATCRDGRVETVELGDRAAAVPSVLFLGPDGSVQVGEPANRAALRDPARVTREFKRRVGDPAPLIIGGSPFSADGVVAKLLGWVVDTVASREGGPPNRVSLTHPANWGQYKRDLMRQAAERAGVGQVSLLTEPAAAAACYAATDRVEVGTTVAVYDLGGGTFDATVLRKTPVGFELLGSPQGIERLGGIDFDEAIFAHVRSDVGQALDTLDPTNPTDIASVAQLRAECVAAKETLSADTEAAIAVMLPGAHTTVRLTRTEFEGMIHSAIAETVRSLGQAVASAGLSPAAVDTVLLVGGSSRIPLVSQLVSAEFRRPIATDIHPTNAVALGAAHLIDLRPARPTPAARQMSGALAGPAEALRSPAQPASPAAARSASPAAARSASPAAARSASPAPAAARPAAPARPASRPAALAANTPPARTRVARLDDVPPARPSAARAGAAGSSGGSSRSSVRRYAPVAALVIVALLIAGSVVWFATRDTAATSAADITAPTTAAAGKAGAPAAPKSESAAPSSAAPAKPTVQSLHNQPCTALTDAQARGLDVASPGAPGAAGLCKWTGQGAPDLQVSAVTGKDAFAEAAAIALGGGWAHYRITVVGGHEAAAYGNGDRCSVTVKLGPKESITAESSGSPQDANGCQRATSAAESVVANL